jgi:hypothetical protein
VARRDPVRAAASREVGAVGLAAEPPPHRSLSYDSTGRQLAAPNSTAASAGGPSRSPASLVALCLGGLPWAFVSLAWSPAIDQGTFVKLTGISQRIWQWKLHQPRAGSASGLRM